MLGFTIDRCCVQENQLGDSAAVTSQQIGKILVFRVKDRTGLDWLLESVATNFSRGYDRHCMGYAVRFVT